MATPPRMSWFDFVLLIGISILLAVVFNESNPNGIPYFQTLPSQSDIPSIPLSAAVEEYKQGQAVFVDAMPAGFYKQKHIKGAVNMPMAIFDIVYLMTFDEEDKSKKIIVYGRTISKLFDLEVASRLAQKGYKNARVLDARLSDWEKKGYPVEP